MPNRIKELRKGKGLTLDALSEKVNIKRGTLNNYENEKTEPKLETWLKLADYFDVSLGYIQGFEKITKNEVITGLWILWSTDYDATMKYFSDYANFINQKSSILEQLEDLDDLGDMPENPPSDFIKIIALLLDDIFLDIDDKDISFYNIYNEYHSALEPNRDTDILYNAFTTAVRKVINKDRDDAFKKTFKEFDKWEKTFGYMNLSSSINSYYDLVNNDDIFLDASGTRDDKLKRFKRELLSEIDTTIKMLESTKKIVEKLSQS